jgi:membrane-associated HD superfamily phosphohydrolase
MDKEFRNKIESYKTQVRTKACFKDTLIHHFAWSHNIAIKPPLYQDKLSFLLVSSATFGLPFLLIALILFLFVPGYTGITSTMVTIFMGSLTFGASMLLFRSYANWRSSNLISWEEL